MNRLVVVNPTARRAAGARRLLERLAADGQTEVRETGGPGDASDVARRAREKGAAEVVAAGGDGTVNEVVNGLGPFRRDEAAAPPEDGAGVGDSRPSLGVLPLGTGNDVARSLGVPLDLGDAVDVLESGARRSVDVGRVAAVRERCFLNFSICGVGGLVERRLSPRLKRWLGAYSYRVAALSALRHVPRYRVTLEWADGRESLRAVAYSVIVANGSRAGGGIPVAPGARMDDGLLDLVVVRAGRARRLPGLVRAVLRGRHPERGDVSLVRARAVTVRSRPPMWVSVDGEPLGETVFEAEIVPRALTVLVPSGRSGGGERAEG